MNPPSEYRGTPFWSWNTRLDIEKLKHQIDIFRQMGFGGFHIHARIGLDTPYLGDEFMEAVKECNSYGKKSSLLTWLYDEDKWPSGYGGGRVTADRNFRNRYLLFSPNHYKDGQLIRNLPQTSRMNPDGDVSLLAAYSVTLENGYLTSYERLEGTSLQDSPGQQSDDSTLWYAYRVVCAENSWFNGQAYVDTLNPKAIERFIEVTHTVYEKHIGEEFSNSIPAIFTDEPQHFPFERLKTAQGFQELALPYTDTMDKVFKDSHGCFLLDKLPEVLWQTKSGDVSIRYWYHDLIAEMFSKAYTDTLGAWCASHGIMSTGHLMGEPTLDEQTRFIGEAMRCYRGFQLPGIDLLADHYEYLTAKQAQSAAHQYGAPGVLSELYGVTNWDFDFRGHKRQGDWQAVLGVTVRTPHLSWVSMQGEAKRDYPAPIDQHSPWYSQYRIIEDHFARVALAMTRGRPVVKVGVIHPLESYWVASGPDDQTLETRETLEAQLDTLIQWLLFDQIDFDLISESQLPRLAGKDKDAGFSVGAMTYAAVIIPPLITIRSTTLQFLQRFIDKGGTVISLGTPARYVDAKESQAPLHLAAQCTCIGFDQWSISAGLNRFRDVDIRMDDGARYQDLIYQMREEEKEKWLFIAHGKQKDRKKLRNFVVKQSKLTRISVRGDYDIVLYDTLRPRRIPLDASHKDGWTTCEYEINELDSLLLRLFPASGEALKTKETPRPGTSVITGESPWELRLPVSVPYGLEEPNCILLDVARYRVDGNSWEGPEEILRMDTSIRKRFGYLLRSENFLQPWLIPDNSAHYEHSVELLFSIDSHIADIPVSLACEMPGASIMWNEEPVDIKPSGFFVDECLPTIPLGKLRKRENILMLKFPFGIKTNMEWCYLLGDFGVSLQGTRIIVVEKPKEISFGDISRQVFPFYGGTLTYRTEIDAPGGNWMLYIAHYAGALVTVRLDGRNMDFIIGEPWSVNLGDVASGTHLLELTLFGTRYNSFGQVHNCDVNEAYWGPKTWRSSGLEWTYGYKLKPFGILTEPTLIIS